MPWYVVTHLGVGIETDAFFASGALPQLIFLVASFSLTQVLVPLLATEDEKTFRRDAWGFFLGVTGFFLCWQRYCLCSLVIGCHCWSGLFK